VRITALRKLVVEAADNGLLVPELANGITRVNGVAAKVPVEPWSAPLNGRSQPYLRNQG
jgi:hypothetical protein